MNSLLQLAILAVMRIYMSGHEIFDMLLLFFLADFSLGSIAVESLYLCKIQNLHQLFLR